MDEIKKKELKSIGSILLNEKRPLKERFRALFTLRNLGGQDSIDAISACFTDPSALLKHELAYCLGQMGDKRANPILTKILSDQNQEPMVRHEAGEALGAIGDQSSLTILQKYCKDPTVEVAETCQLAVSRINWMHNESNGGNYEKSPFNSVDPAPSSCETDINKLEKCLTDESESLFNRYRAMFSLRNINSKESANALAEGFKGSSALFRHEIGYVLGQMSFDSVVEDLAAVVRDKNENEMVRHEAAEALGCIANDKAMEILKQYLKDDSRVVRESCEVALDMCDYENSSEFQYANALLQLKNNSKEIVKNDT